MKHNDNPAPPLPPAFAHTMQGLLGQTSFANFAAALESPAPVSVLKNVLKNTPWPENYAGVKWNTNGVYLPSRPVFTLDPAFQAGAYYVQEASSMVLPWVAQQLLPPNRPWRVLDLCAAPGGKSVGLANVLPPDSLLVCNEVIRARFQVLRYNLTKWGHPGTAITHHDSSDFLPLAGWFDLVLIDAPCSGEGLFRKDPAARLEWSEEAVTHCAARQRRILADAATLVKPGGVLLYSTCTYNLPENDHNATWLAQQTDLAVAALEVPPHWNLSPRQPGYQFYPHLNQGEGLYFCAFQRSAEVQVAAVKPAHSFRKIAPLDRALLPHAQPWLAQGDDYSYWQEPAGRWRAIPAANLTDLQTLSGVLPRLEAGVPLGEWKGRQLAPAPELALYAARSTTVPTVALDRDTALAFLRKETPPLPQPTRGWTLATYQNLGLGWLKGLDRRYNNYYPKEWRIRMDARTDPSEAELNGGL